MAGEEFLVGGHVSDDSGLSVKIKRSSRRRCSVFAGTVSSVLAPVPLQRLEGAILLIPSVVGFAASDWSWWWFAGLLLVPDISMVGYLLRPSTGAAVYNLGHSLIGPALLFAWWWYDGSVWAIAFGSIWLAHIGMDRMFGYGLKFSDGFNHTHLGEIGRGGPDSRTGF